MAKVCCDHQLLEEPSCLKLWQASLCGAVLADVCCQITSSSIFQHNGQVIRRQKDLQEDKSTSDTQLFSQDT